MRFGHDRGAVLRLTVLSGHAQAAQDIKHQSSLTQQQQQQRSGSIAARWGVRHLHAWCKPGDTPRDPEITPEQRPVPQPRPVTQGTGTYQHRSWDHLMPVTAPAFQ
jgi:hypothetical protein